MHVQIIFLKNIMITMKNLFVTNFLRLYLPILSEWGLSDEIC